LGDGGAEVRHDVLPGLGAAGLSGWLAGAVRVMVVKYGALAHAATLGAEERGPSRGHPPGDAGYDEGLGEREGRDPVRAHSGT
jgi:hypothetical protein